MNPKCYSIPFANDTKNSPDAAVSTYLWENNGYTPETNARLAINGECLFLHMECRESRPLARFTETGSPVCCDSCLEFFFSPNDCEAYCNLEVNANGCLLCGFGTSRHGRVPAEILLEAPRATVCEEKWYIDLVISLEKVKKLFRTEEIQYFTGNFYKCGDETAFPHYGMWAEVDSAVPDFHRPEYFGILNIEKVPAEDKT